jgi:hypothetical protein
VNYVHELVLNEKITNDLAAKTVDIERFFTISLFLSHISFFAPLRAEKLA